MSTQRDRATGEKRTGSVTRRNFLALGAMVGAGSMMYAGGQAFAAPGAPPVPATPFTTPLPIPPVLKPVSQTATSDIYTMRMAETTTPIFPGNRTKVLTFNGSYPGPTIVARRGRETVVRITNAMSSRGSSVHLHGADVPPEFDGHPTDIIPAGGTKEYRYPNIQPAAPLWYHDHAHHVEAEQVYRGLHGAYLLGDGDRDALKLPSGQFDLPLQVRDAQFGSDNQLVFKLDDFVPRTTVLVNGAVQPRHTVRHRKYLLRLYNASNTRPMTFQLNPLGEFFVVASDGGLLARPVRLNKIELWPAERAEIVVDFTQYKPDASVFLENVFGGNPPNKQLLRFDIKRANPDKPDPDDSRVPDALRTLPDFGRPTVQRTINFARDPANTFYAIDGKGYDPKRIDFDVRRNTTELWTVNNNDGQYNFPHSMHPHVVQFRVLDRQGVAVPVEEAYPKDTVRILAGQSIRMLVRFATPYTGVYPYHCHFLDHSSNSMMAQFRLV